MAKDYLPKEYDPMYWVELTCPVCGKKFMKKRRLVTENTCCSHACSRILISRKKNTLQNPNGNFRFTQEELTASMDHPKEKVLKCVCVKCGKEFLISFRQYWEVINASKKGEVLGVTCSMKCALSDVDQEEALKKRNKTYEEKYGSKENFFKSMEEKRSETILERYGCENIANVHEIEEKRVLGRRKAYYKEFLAQLKKKGLELLTPYEDYVSIRDITLKIRCTLCGTEFEVNTTSPQRIICPTCRRLPYSVKEKMLCNFIQEIYKGEILTNVRSNGVFDDWREIDIYLPEKKLGIEFNGNYYHSDKFKKSPTDHQKKTIDAQSKGVRIIHIFEHEWDNNQELVKVLLKNTLGIFDTILNGRDCTVKEINYDEYETFLLNYHLQGSVKSKYRYGLFYNDELVSVIGFGASRFKENEIELHRYCVKSGYLIRGGFNKLIKAFEESTGITKYTSYVDYAHFSGKVYISCGFKYCGMTKPNYVWLSKGGFLYKRMQTQKHKLGNLLGESFDPNLTETENMEKNGFLKLYDCGNLIMRKE